MSATAEKDKPALWDTVKQEVTAGSKGGKAGQWSARKAQLASHEYQKRGGGYVGAKAADNHLQEWTDEAWGTASGKPSGETGERYLPEDARQALSSGEYRATSEKKRADTRAGKQHSQQPPRVARKAAKARKPAISELDKPALMALARQHSIKGRSRMRKAELIAALREQGRH